MRFLYFSCKTLQQIQPLGKCALIVFLCFPGLTGKATAREFSSNMSIEDKIKLTRQIREQMVALPSSSLSDKQQNIVKGPKSAPPSTADNRNIKMILNLPLENRKEALSRYPADVFVVLQRLVFSNKEKMPIRWKALTSLARLYPERSRRTVLKALNHPLWFLRNAGLIAMESIHTKESLRWAGRFLNDPSLIVRTAAVKLIQKHKARQYKFQLLEKLNAPDSFYKNQSLWIRRHIVSALSDFCDPGEEQLFISLLKDPDKTLHPFAVSALEKLKALPPSYDVKRNPSAQKSKWISRRSEEEGGNKLRSHKPATAL